MPDEPQVRAGNAAEAGSQHRGWFIGQFLPAGRLEKTGAVEVKWGEHPAGDGRREPVASPSTTLTLLLAGRMRLTVEGEEYLLETAGDYVLYGPGTLHAWETLADSRVLTVRWPSRPG